MTSHVWKIGSIDLHLAVADLFDLDVSAIVNSDQTDFYLARNPKTISGQIRRRLGSVIQDELDALTQKTILPTGTVLSTGGGALYERIYHAGFHQPGEWLDSEDVDHEADALNTVIRCVRTILTDPDLPESIAFPLLGTGLFGLSPALVAYEFAREILAVGLRGGPRRAVWLAVRRGTYDQIVDSLIQGLIDHHLGVSPIQDLRLGIGYLDQFNRLHVRSADPRFLAWMLLRYAELLASYLLARLAIAAGPAGAVTQLIPIGQSLSFGMVRRDTQHLALQLQSAVSLDPWTRHLRTLVLSDMHLHHRLSHLNEDRNRLAHGQPSRTPSEIEADLRAFIAYERWSARCEALGNPNVDGLEPWLRRFAPGHDDTQGAGVETQGLLNRWTPNKLEYLLPVTGRTMQVAESLT
ncbi:macro domain-containing protein [Thiorhodococcus minor]|uniref:Macro domain-containing protein n=1 Tax=Thiorhodococcus minor TaxID=57489 RepID=A0A6M0JS63_9GAMM|nr:macro domain-containing protein [Thiorhodococcus minor]NEV60362.1 hypothetical protein [Thiorhodococcus minor]